jgi:hypothetical protein
VKNKKLLKVILMLVLPCFIFVSACKKNDVVEKQITMLEIMTGLSQKKEFIAGGKTIKYYGNVLSSQQRAEKRRILQGRHCLLISRACD